MSDRNPASVAPIVGIVALMLYVGAYYAMVRPDYVFIPGSETHMLATYTKSAHVQAVAERLFRPINWLDRRVRPQAWQFPEFGEPRVLRPSSL